MEEILEVTKKSLSIRGNWVKQFTGEKPDFTNLKFYVKLSDKSSLKYADWDSFEADGGAYSISSDDKWSVFSDMQEIVFYLKDNQDIKCKKSVKVSRVPTDIIITGQISKLYSGRPIESGQFIYKIKYKDGSSKEVLPNQIIISPNYIQNGVSGNIKFIFTYTEEDDLFISKEFIFNVEEPSYKIRTFDNEYGRARLIIGGKEIQEASYQCSLEDTIEFKVRAVPSTTNHKFSRWEAGPDSLEIKDLNSSETTITIPNGVAHDLWIKTVWDESVTDKFGNSFVINDGKLEKVILASEEVAIPNEVKIISDDVFSDSNIRNIVFPYNLTFIGVNSFKNCINLTSLEFPKSLLTISKSAFMGCTSLKSIKFNQISPINISRKAFYGCNSLTDLDFLAMGNKFKDCIFGDMDKDVWKGCRLRTVRISKENFTDKLYHLSSDSPFTIRAPYAAKVSMESRISTVRFRVIGTTADGLPDTIVRNYTRNNAWSKEFSSKDRKSENTIYSYGHTTQYDMRETCGCYVVNDNPCHYEVDIYGFNHPDFDYDFYVGVASKYRFTTIGSDSFIHEGEIGEGFVNWNMMDYVNDVLYPNIKDENGNSIINRMIPLYDRRMF